MNPSMASPKTSTARKQLPRSQSAPMGVPKRRRKPSTTQELSKLQKQTAPAEDLATSAQKRKRPGEGRKGQLALPNMKSASSKRGGHDVAVAQMLPHKKPEKLGGLNSETTSAASSKPTSLTTSNKSQHSNRTTQSAPQMSLSPAQMSQSPPSYPPPSQLSQPPAGQCFTHVNAQDATTFLLLSVFKKNPTLIPGDAHLVYIVSSQIDDITNEMWQVAFAHGAMMQDATKYCAMFSELKLRALARLNILPSWWLLREKAVVQLEIQGWKVDDGIMKGTMREALGFCLKVMRGKGDGEVENL